MADEKEHKYGFTGFRVNADKFYRSPAAPMSPNHQQVHYVSRLESEFIKGMCVCGHTWTSWQNEPTCSGSAIVMSTLRTRAPFCPACPVCNGSAKSPQRNIPPQPHRPVDEIKTPDGRIHWITSKLTDGSGQCRCDHFWWANICSRTMSCGIVAECPGCPVCNEEAAQPNISTPWTRSRYAPGTKIATPGAPIAPSTQIFVVLLGALLGGLGLGFALGMWIGGLK